MIGLYPLGSNIFYGLGCHDEFVKSTCSLTQYSAFDEGSTLLKSMSLDEISNRFGPYQCGTRSNLIRVLEQSCQANTIQFNTIIEHLNQTNGQVQVTFSNGKTDHFDLVVGADGFHSQVRKFILLPDEIEIYDSGWGGWVWWSEHNPFPAETIYEHWGTRTFFGGYPVAGKLGVIACVPYPSEASALQGGSRRHYLLNKFSIISILYPEIFAALPSDNDNLFFWPLADRRCRRWVNHRVVLLGDAAAAFLPTAGIGASMAMESAAVLNDVLSRTNAYYLPETLKLFVARRQQRVENAQRDSRRLAKLAFVTPPLMAWIRNFYTKRASTKKLLGSIVNSFDVPI